MKPATCNSILIIIIIMLCIYTNAFAQNTTENGNVIKEQTSESPIRFQLSGMIAINKRGSDKNFKSAIGNDYSTTFQNISASPKLSFEYFTKGRFGIGVDYTSFQTEFEALRYAGTIYDEGGWFLIFFYIPPTSTAYYDRIAISTKGNSYSGYLTYKPLKYSNQNQLWEVIARSGISVTTIEENRELGAYLVKSNSFNAEYTTSNHKKTAYNGFVNAQLLLHLGKSFSFILADLTQNFGIVNPTIEQTSVTVGYSKDVTVKEHKVNVSGFSFSTGVAMHF